MRSFGPSIVVISAPPGTSTDGLADDFCSKLVESIGVHGLKVEDFCWQLVEAVDAQTFVPSAVAANCAWPSEANAPFGLAKP